MVRSRLAHSPIAFWSLMVFMGILLVAPQALFPILAPLRIALLAAGVALTAHVVTSVTAGRPILIMTREMRISLCLLGWATVTVPLSLWPGGSVDTLTDLFLKSLILFWLIANTVITVSRFRQFAWGLTLMTVPISSSALVDYVSGTYLLGTQRIVGYAAGLTNNPNDLALTLNLIIPLILALLWRTRGALRRAILLTVLGLDIAGVILSFSRGGFITLVVILAITSARLLRSRRRAWGIALLAIFFLCLPLLPGSYWHRIATITDIDSDETGSAQARRENTLGALRFVLTHPIVGAGIGSNMLALNEEVGSTWRDVHNAYLQYAVDLGLPGLGLFLALFSTCFAAASAARSAVGRRRGARDLTQFAQATARSAVGRRRGARDLTQFAQATRLSLIAFGVAGLFHPVAYHFYFYYLAGLASALRLAGPRVVSQTGLTTVRSR
jgi:O-antigen ligase